MKVLDIDKLNEVKRLMKSTPQTETQSVWDHGQSVQNYTFDLLNHLRCGEPLKFNWKLPDWIYDPMLISHIPSDETIGLYTLYHDCGKPYCLSYGEDGRRHFHNHADVSHDTFNTIITDTIAADLIRRDMSFHVLKSDDMDEFVKYEYCTMLIISALSEIHSNAEMFGGMESTSFKIKWKHTNKRGRQILEKLKLI